MTIALATSRSPTDLSRLWRGAPAFTGPGLLLGLGMIPLFAALALDDRLFQGESVWLKPLKFHAALLIYLFTLACFARYMTPATRASSLWRGFVATLALHAVPLVGLAATRLAPAVARNLVLAASLAYSAFVLAAFARSLAGQPFLPALG